MSRKIPFLFSLVSAVAVANASNLDTASVMQQNLQLMKGSNSAAAQPHVEGTKLIVKPSRIRLQGKENASVIINNLTVVGATVYTNADIQTFYQSLMGRSSSINDYIQATEKLIDQYWRDGYVLAEADLKVSDFKDGDYRLTLTLHEGAIEESEIIGGDQGLRSLVQTYITLLQENKPFRTQAFEYYSGLFEDIPGFTVKGKVIPDKQARGKGKIQLTLLQNKLVPYASLDNRGSRYMGPYRGNLGASTHSTFQGADVTAVNFMFTPGSNELYYGRLSHTLPLTYDGKTLQIRADYADMKPGYSLREPDIKSDSYMLRLQYQQKSFTTPGHQMAYRIGFEILSAHAKNPAYTLYNDRTNSFFLGVGDSFIDPLKGRYNTNFQIQQGIREFGSSTFPGEKSRPLGRADFTKFTGDISRVHAVSREIAVTTQLRGQYSLKPLLATQQFLFGSYPFGSAYEPAELSGDHGTAARAEIRYGFEPNNQLSFNGGHGYIFYDIGKVWNRDKSSGPTAKSAASAGVGTRLTVFGNYGLNVELAKALTHGLSSRFQSSTKKPLRLLFKLETRF